MSLFWKVTAPGKPTSYIFGTMHLQSKSAYSHFACMQNLILEKPRYFAETDLEDLRANQALVAEAYTFKDSKLLSDHVEISKYRKWKATVKRFYSVDLDGLSRYIPFYISNLLLAFHFDKSYHQPLDGALWDFAKANNRELAGLESAKEQINILDAIPLESQFKQLNGVLRKPNKAKLKGQMLGRHFENQNIRMLYQITRSDLGSLRKMMLFQRNAIMAQRIDSQLEFPACYSFGAAHLAGKFGVLNLLKQKGCVVKSIKTTIQAT